MAGQISSIKRQLRSVTSTKKLTNAMQLVATAKLQKLKRRMEQNDIYAQKFKNVLSMVCASEDFDGKDNIYFSGNSATSKLYIVVTSDSGLCGSYNPELLKYARSVISKDDKIISIGIHGAKQLKLEGYDVIKEFDKFDNLSSTEVNEFLSYVLDLYLKNEVSCLQIIYTRYINTLTYKPTLEKLLPMALEEVQDKKPILLEPSNEKIIERLVPMYVTSQIYSLLLQAKCSEQAARRAAMDNANRNADELISDLRLNYNQARQAAITQEMNEITAGTIRDVQGGAD